MASVTYSATQADGIASDFSNAGVPRIEVVSNKYSTNTGTAECAGIGTAGPAFSVGADLQVDCDINCPLGSGFAESVVVSFRDSTNYSGYGFQTTNQSIASSWCILRYPSGGGTATKLTTVTRTNGAAEHLTFTRANSTGVINLYSNGTLVTTATDATYAAGQLFIMALLDSGAPGSATTIDNIVISDAITGPPSAGVNLASASGIGASTATATRLGSARPIAATSGIGASTAVAVRIGLARPIAAVSGIGGSTAAALRLGGAKAIAATSGIGASSATATTLLTSAGLSATSAGLSSADATGLAADKGIAGTSVGLSTAGATSLTKAMTLAGTSVGLSTAGASLSSGNSIAFTASQPDGPAIDFAAAGAAHVIEVLDRRYSSNGYTSATTDYGSGVATIPFDISGDLQVDLDLTAPLVTGNGGVNLFFLNAGDGSGYGIFAGNAWHIQRYNVGGSHTNLTNETRTARSEHLTFTRRASDGQMNAYANGSLVTNIADLGSIVTGQTMVLYLVDTDYATLGEATADNIVVSNIITGPPPYGAISAEALGTSTATGALTKGVSLPAAAAGGASSTTSTLTQSRALAGTSAGIATTTGVTGAVRPLQGLAAGAGLTAATLDAGSPGAPWQGLAAGAGATTADLGKSLPLIGTAIGLSGTSAFLSRAVPIAGSADGQSAATASALVSGSGFAGIAAGNSATSAVSLAALVALAGASAGTSTASTALGKAMALSALATAAGMSTTTGAISIALYHAVQVWYGGSWQTMTIRVWNGNNWSDTARVWNGTEWQVLA